MGVLRLMLALSVLTFHSPIGAKLAGGQLAVEAFFIISGFYMALLLRTNRYGTVKTFLWSRWWRLWPLYVTASLITLLARVAMGDDIVARWFAYGPAVAGLAVVSNGLMIGLDALFYVESQVLDVKHTLLLVYQAWSLGLEVLFVLVAPRVVRLPVGGLLAIVAISQLCRGIVWFSGAGWDFWNYHFFPFEIGLFVAGVVGYDIWQRLTGSSARWLADYRWFATVAWLATASVLLWPLPGEAVRALYLFLIVVAVPGLFGLTKSSRLDRWIGELSYPFYLYHLLAIAAMTHFAADRSPTVQMLFAVAITMALSAVSLAVI